ncbi:MAG: Rrf2 family transcriptional regulator [Proteobacteria bacterium]|nr:Rrf2 family transcriptional regulator [Pseudomonadota bacterium]MBU1742457.1 Rrf2 family transcriptional regulator [Pseudomonadota bacterium]
MKISTRGRYGTRAMLDLANHFGQGPISLKDLASRQEISAKYLEQLLIPLRTAGIIKSIRGAKGGYVLSREPGSVCLDEIILILEGSMAPVECVDNPESCHRSCTCVTHEVWCAIGDKVTQMLRDITLRDLVTRDQHKAEQAQTALA